MVYKFVECGSFLVPRSADYFRLFLCLLLKLLLKCIGGSMLSKRFLLGAIPTVLLCTGGTLALANVRKGRYEVQDERDKQLAQADTKRKRFSIEEEYEVRDSLAFVSSHIATLRSFAKAIS